jgi:hypothetical protein
MAKLVCCSSCATFILPGEAACPFCGARQRSLGRAAGVLAVGLALGACGNDDGTPEMETFESAAAYGVPATESDSLTPTTEPATDTSSGSESGSSSSESSSGSTGSATDTDGDTGTGTDTDTDTGGTSLEPDYGVPTTTG